MTLRPYLPAHSRIAIRRPGGTPGRGSLKRSFPVLQIVAAIEPTP
jgi:hypothetical protein